MSRNNNNCPGFTVKRESSPTPEELAAFFGPPPAQPAQPFVRPTGVRKVSSSTRSQGLVAQPSVRSAARPRVQVAAHWGPPRRSAIEHVKTNPRKRTPTNFFRC